MAKNDVDPKVQHPGGRDKNFSWVKTKGVWRKLEQKKQKQTDTEEADEKERKKRIKDILGHEMYTKHTHGQERVDGILGELLELQLLTDEQYKKYVGKNLKLESVKDVENLIEYKGEMN